MKTESSAKILPRTGKDKIKGLILMIAKPLVNKPDYLNLREIQNQKITIPELRVTEENPKKVIGENDALVHAMRTILNVTLTKLRKRVALEIIQ